MIPATASRLFTNSRNFTRNLINNNSHKFSKNARPLAASILQTQRRNYSDYSDLPEEVQMIRDQAKQFTEDVLFKTAAKNDMLHLFPTEEMKQIGELGFMGMKVPEELGGFGASNLAYAVVMEEIARGCPVCALTISIHNSLYCEGVNSFGNAEQKKDLENYATGEKIGVFALSEPGNGSDAAAASTTAVKKGDKWVLNGTKQWISGSYEGENALVFATTDKAAKHKGISCFIVPLKACKLGAKEDKLGIRASSTAQVIMEDTEIPAENLLGNEGDGFKIAMKLLDGGRVGIAAQALGIAQASFECAAKYSLEREAFGKPIGKTYAIQQKLAEMDIKIWSARLLTWQAAYLKDNGLPYGRAGARAKVAASQAANFCSFEAIQVLGGMGYVSDMPAERYYRDARITEIYEGTTEINKMVIGNHVFKEFGEFSTIPMPDHFRNPHLH